MNHQSGNLLPSKYHMRPVREAVARESKRWLGLAFRGTPLATLAAGVLFVLLRSALAAQEPAAPIGQQAGAGAPLHTGTSSGLTEDARLLHLLAEHQYSRIEAQLGQLPPELAQFYRGILANRKNDPVQSIQLLEPLSDLVAQSRDPVHEKLLRKALAEDYLRLGQFAKAADAYQALDARLKDNLTADEQDEIEMPLKLLPLARDNPSTTVEPCDPFKLPVSEDPLGLIDVPVSVDGRSRNWMLDPTLPFNLIARSTAKDAGLEISKASAAVDTLTGRSMEIRATTIPRFTIGGRLTLRDMTAFVYNDKDYYFPQTSYQVEGVLGYPALAAMGSLTVTSDNAIFVRPGKQISPPEANDRLADGARFYLDGDRVIVALGRAGTDNERMFSVDAGGQQTYLTSRYFDEHAADFSSQKTEAFTLLGAQSTPQSAYAAEDVRLQAGAAEFTLHFIHVLPQPLGSASLDDVYGVLGTDALGQLKSYTFDYRTMRFAVTVQ